MQASAANRSTPQILALLAVAATFGGAAAAAWRLANRVETLAAQDTANQALLQEVRDEITRIRLEQRAEALGPAGLLAKLKHYAPLLTSARTPEPDYQAAKKEMDAILRAFAAIGSDAWTPVTARLRELSGDKNFDEVRWLLRAAVRIDPKAGKEIVKDVLAGTRLPAPRLRWDAARLMTEIDKPLAQTMLRRILNTESSRGFNVERGGGQGAPIPDAAALSATGFNNYVQLYLQTEDPAIDETLLMVIGRAEHDTITVQECVEALGKRHCERAVPAIEKLYRNPPNQQENPIFLVRCLTALHEIQGPAARAFLEEALRTATSDVVANHCKSLLNEATAPTPAGKPGNQRPQAENSIAPPGRK